MWIFRILSGVVFLTSIILSIPLAFDVGGRTCGLAFSLSLATFYFTYSILRIATPPESPRWRYVLVKAVGWTQWILVPTLMIWSLNKFAVDADNSGGWVERTFNGKRAGDASVREWLFGPNGLLETATIGSWDKLLTYSTPVFQLCEGFCSLLVIQAAGQISRWMVNRGRSDTWMVWIRIVKSIRFPTLTEGIFIDWLACNVSFHHLKLRILSVEGHSVPRDWQCRCNSHWRHNNLCRLPLRMGYRER